MLGQRPSFLRGTLARAQVAAGRGHLLGTMLRQTRLDIEAVAQDAAQCDASIVQRKPEPWDALALSLAESGAWEGTNSTGRKRQPLIICASLVDKARPSLVVWGIFLTAAHMRFTAQVPNVAGLVRTAEVFAASQLVVDDMRVLAHNAFKSIAVTAQAHVPIEAVPPANLQPWLRARRRAGWHIVALEQCADSVPLDQVRVCGQNLRHAPTNSRACARGHDHLRGAVMRWRARRTLIVWSSGLS